QYAQARDRDALRFRTDAALNGIIREVAAAHADAGVRLADAERAFAQQSAEQLPGEALFLEHVHMTFQGNWLLARTVFEALMQQPPAALGAGGSGEPLGEAACALRLGQTEWNEWKFGGKVYERLLEGPPFTWQLDHERRCQQWKERLEAL